MLQISTALCCMLAVSYAAIAPGQNAYLPPKESGYKYDKPSVPFPAPGPARPSFPAPRPSYPQPTPSRPSFPQPRPTFPQQPSPPRPTYTPAPVQPGPG